MSEGRSDGAELGEVIGGLLRDRTMRRGLALGRLARAWESVVGAALAGETSPVALDDRGLVVAASSGAWAAQVRFLSREVAKRASEVLGGQEIASVRVVVERGRGTPR